MNIIKLWWQITCKVLSNQRGDLKQMFTLPKSKSPWEAMTSGSTGGWAKGISPTAKGIGKYAGPAITAGLGMIPGVGPALSAGAGMLGMAGAGGFQGTDSGWGKGLLDTAGGALMGYGMGSLGAGVKGAAKGVMQGVGNPALKGLLQPAGNRAMMGFQSGIKGFMGTPIIPGMSGTSGTNLMSGAQKLLGGGAGTGGGTGTFGGGVGAPMGGGITGIPGESAFNLKSIASKILGGGMLLGSMAQKPPSIGTSPDMARQATEMPDLVQARDMIKTMAMANPNEFAESKQIDQFIDNAVEKSTEAYQAQRKIIENNLSSKGKVLGKSGGAAHVLTEFDKSHQENVDKFITDTKWAAYTAGINRQVKAVADYYQVSEQAAADMLATYGYISPEDLLNYQSAMADYQGAQQLMGSVGGRLLAPQSQ